MAATRSSSGNRRTASKPKRTAPKPAAPKPKPESQNGRSEGAKEALPVATALAGAAAGVVGGVVLGRTKLQRTRKVLGIKVPAKRDGMETLAKNVSEAGKQFGKLASEVRAARQKAEGIGKALS
jgi:hypothetical protein